MSKLKENTIDLQSILDTVNNLPEAGNSGSNGGSVETCTVVVSVKGKIDAERFGNVDIENSSFSKEEVILYSRNCSGSEFDIHTIKNSLMSFYSSGEPFTYEVSGEVYDYIISDDILIVEVYGDGAVSITFEYIE